MYLLNVFTNEKGKNGTPLGVVEDFECKITQAERLKITKDTGFTEVVLLNQFKIQQLVFILLNKTYHLLAML